MYKEKRIQELKEPKAVMPSTLAQEGPGASSSGLSSSPSFGTSSGASFGSSTPTTPLTTGRKVCPNCGASGSAIKEVEDKTKIVSYIPKPIYAKKNVCTKCGYEF